MRYQYWIDAFSGLSNAKKIHLHSQGLTAQELYMMPREKLEKLSGLTCEEVDKFVDNRGRYELDREWCLFSQKDINFTCIELDNYPSKLKNIINPPFALYFLGQLPDEIKRSIAIVGSRGRSAYGSAVAEKIARTLASKDIQVISGLARGIDSDGHKGALEGKGQTYGVLGCGVDVCYPRSNKFLYDKVIASGGVISELPPGTQPMPYFFPMRNRIISGLCDTVIVVEAREKSGSLITADFAMEQGRDVFAVPGRISDPLSMGCNRLIKQGAGVILSPEDLLSDLDLFTNNCDIQLSFTKKLLEKDESLVYSLTDFRPVDLGTLLEKTTYEIYDLINILTSLEGKGFVKEVFPNHYVRII